VVIYLCLFNNAFNGFDYTVFNINELVIIKQKRYDFICQQFLVKDKKNHGKPSIRAYLRSEIRNRDLPKNVQYCTHKRNVRSVAVANFRVPKECLLQFNELSQ